MKKINCKLQIERNHKKNPPKQAKRGRRIGNEKKKIDLKYNSPLVTVYFFFFGARPKKKGGNLRMCCIHTSKERKGYQMNLSLACLVT